MEKRLIAEIKKHKSIYDKSCLTYRNRKPWQSISEALGIPVVVCKHRWINLQERYEKEYKKIQEASGSDADEYESCWEHFELMDFLREHVQPTQKVNSSKDPLCSAEPISVEEKLIEEIKKHKSLFDKNCRTYHNRIMHVEAWQSISEALEVPVIVCKSRWGSLRDRYVKEYKKSQEASGSAADEYESRWEHFKSMSFLRQHVQPKREVTNGNGSKDWTSSAEQVSTDGELIEEIKKHICLFDKSYRTHRHRKIRSDAWQSISEALETPVLVCKSRWISLHDRYVKESQKTRTRWEHFKSMNFLRDHLEPGIEVASVTDSRDSFSSAESVSLEEKLIEEIRHHKSIFDKNSHAYYNRILRAEVWQSISDELGIPVLACKSRWRSLRDRYVREYQKIQQSSGSGAGEYESCWEHFELMNFLQPHVQSTQEVTSVNDSKHCIPSAEPVSTEEKLIEEIKNHQCIFDKSSPAHGNRILRAEVWQSISDALDIPISSCQCRWRSLRDRYVREFQKTEQSRWEYYKLMDFLRPHMHSRKEETSVNDSKDSLFMGEIENFDKGNLGGHLEIPVRQPLRKRLRDQNVKKPLKKQKHTSRSAADVSESRLEHFEITESQNLVFSNEQEQSPEAPAKKKRSKRKPSSTLQAKYTMTEIAEERFCQLPALEEPDEHQGFFLMCRDLFKNIPSYKVDDAKIYLINYLHGQIKEMRDY